MVSHDRGPPVAWLPNAPDRFRLRAAGPAHRPGTDRTTRRGAVDGRPGQCRARAHACSRPFRRCSTTATCWWSTTPRSFRRDCACVAERVELPRCCCSSPSTDDRRTWEAMIRPARKLRVGEHLVDAAGEAFVEIGRRMASGDTWAVTIVADGDPLELLQTHGEMPLPPYIGVQLDRTRSLSDGLRGRARFVGRADRRTALHTRPVGRDRRAWSRGRQGRIGRRARHVQAGRGRRSNPARDPQRALSGGRTR